jgi:hypothetical protein
MPFLGVLRDLDFAAGFHLQARVHLSSIHTPSILMIQAKYCGP